MYRFLYQDYIEQGKPEKIDRSIIRLLQGEGGETLKKMRFIAY